MKKMISLALAFAAAIGSAAYAQPSGTPQAGSTCSPSNLVPVMDRLAEEPKAGIWPARTDRLWPHKNYPQAAA